MKWIKYCNSFSLLDPWEKMWTFWALPWGVPTKPARCSLLSGCLVSVEDKRLRKCVILDGSATIGTRANNEFTSSSLFSNNLKFDQQKFAKSRMR